MFISITSCTLTAEVFIFKILECWNYCVFSFSCVEHFDAAMTKVIQKNRSSVRILDAGAGRGSTASYLRSLGYNTIDALTVSKERLENAERSGLYRNLLFTALKANSTLCATGAFDAVICAGGVFPDEVDPDAIDEMLRLVKPGKVTSPQLWHKWTLVKLYDHHFMDLIAATRVSLLCMCFWSDVLGLHRF